MPKTSSRTPNKSKETQHIDTDKPEFKFNPDVIKGHRWKQQGPYLVCKSCDLSHSMWIGMGKLLMGFEEDGKPKLKKR